MPPRTRKTAAPSPTLEEAAAPTSEVTAPPEPATPTSPEAEAPPTPSSEVPSGPAAAEKPGAPEVPAVDPEPALSPRAQAVSALLEPPTATYSWVSVRGDGAAPCRTCSPAGPPAGAGSFGCAHGQWVRVQDDA